jgi:hypothetical protein
VLSGLAAPVKRSGPRLDLFVTSPPGFPLGLLERPVPFADYVHNVGLLYSVEQGGMTTRPFLGLGSAHLLERRSPAVEPDLEVPNRALLQWLNSEESQQPEQAPVRRAIISELLSYAPQYEDVILYGNAGDIEVLSEKQFHIDYRQDGLAIARFRPCPLTVRLLDSGGSRAFIDGKWFPRGRVRPLDVVAPASGDDTTPRTHTIANSPCGPFWVRVLIDRDGDGQPSQGDAPCRGADRHGFLAITSSLPGASLDCVAPTPPTP